MDYNWQQHWTDSNTPWDLGGPHPHLKLILNHIAEKRLLPPNASFYVPGCGRAHDAAAIARAGYHVIAEDIVPEAIEAAKALYGTVENLEFRVGDSLTKKMGEVNAIYDRAMFNALEPALNEKYLKSCHSRLKPSGLMTGVLFTRFNRSAEGPPFAINLARWLDLTRSLWKPILTQIEERATTGEGDPMAAISQELVYVGRRLKLK